ncbi:MAG: hypothetical protein ISN29_04425 [Gammaproteobacteria bacterium AqS3]|nr:hypothetical protein [Gammaproteobacteria bacterium AqS3]
MKNPAIGGAFLILGGLLLSAGYASGLEGSNSAQSNAITMIMQSAINTYFDNEKTVGMSKLILALLCLLGALIFYRRGPFGRGLSYPLVAIGVIEFIVGGTIYFRTDDQVSSLLAQLQTDQAAFFAEETERMALVVANFPAYKIGQLVMVALGAIAGLYAYWRLNMTLLGTGAGLSAAGFALWVTDASAVTEASTYYETIQQLNRWRSG